MIAERLRRQQLTGPGLPGPVAVLSRFGAMQAQDFPGVLWAIAQRTSPRPAPTETDLLDAFDAGAFIRTHLLRPTWHLVLPDDLRWMLALSGPRVQAANRGGYTRLAITPAVRLKAESVLQRTLEGGRACTRHELADALRRARIAPDNQRLVYLLMHAELEGLICSGPRRGVHHTYTLLDERVAQSRPLERDEALARLVGTYFTARGPASVTDCAWWSGLTQRDVREGIALAGDRLEARAGGRWAGRTGQAPPRPDSDRRQSPRVHLLPNFDEYTVAYRDRAALLDRDTPVTSASQMRLLSQPVLLNGRHAGSWRRRPASRHAATFSVEIAWNGWPPAGSGVRTAIARYAAYLGPS